VRRGGGEEEEGRRGVGGGIRGRREDGWRRGSGWSSKGSR
jgi:hypothetical protein